MNNGKKGTLLCATVILLAGILAYLNSFSGPFVFDDEYVILANPHIKRLWPVREAFLAPPKSPGRDRPVINLTFSINYALGGFRVGGYHLVNLTIHLASALLLLGILRRTFSRVGEVEKRYAAAASALSLCIALLWVLHPLQTESVTYIVQRCESLMGLFYLGTWYCVIRGSGFSPPDSACHERKMKPARQVSGLAGGRKFLEGKGSSSRLTFRDSYIWYSAAVIFCALGMGTKATMVTSPILILIYDRIFLSRSWQEVLQKRRGLYAGLVSTWLVQAALLLNTSYADIKSYAPLEYARSQPGVILHYLRLTFWPYPLCLDYCWPVAKSLGEIVAPALVMVILLAVTIWFLVKRPFIGFLGVWFFLVLAPTSSIMPLEDLAFEHRMYLPLAAVLTAIVVGVYEFLRRVFPSAAGSRKIAATFLLTAAVAVLGILTVRRNLDYRSPETVWRDVVSHRPSNFRAHMHLGNALLKQGKAREALESYFNSLRAKKDYHPAYYNLGNVLSQMGNFQGAIDYYNRALAIDPRSVETHNNLGVLLAQRGRTEEAVKHFQEAMHWDPDDPAAYYNLGLILLQKGKAAEAEGYFARAVELKPDCEPALLGLQSARRSREASNPAATSPIPPRLKPKADLTAGEK